MKKSKIKKHLIANEEDAIAEDYYRPKKFGEGKSVEYEIDGLTHSFCKVTEWANGEGYDVSFESEVTKDKWEKKRIELHHDEIDVFLACLNNLKYFG
jgi:hypothetical protein